MAATVLIAADPLGLESGEGLPRRAARTLKLPRRCQEAIYPAWLPGLKPEKAPAQVRVTGEHGVPGLGKRSRAPRLRARAPLSARVGSPRRARGLAS